MSNHPTDAVLSSEDSKISARADMVLRVAFGVEGVIFLNLKSVCVRS